MLVHHRHASRIPQIPIWCQRSSREPGGVVCWDYHVVLVRKEPGSVTVWDQDTTLGFPCTLAQYAQQALRCSTSHLMHPSFQR